MNKVVNITKIRSNAIDLYLSEKCLCAEAVIASIAKNLAPEMPKSLISAASGFSIGVGAAQCMCGTVSAGVLSLGYFFGRDFPTTITDPDSQKTIALSFELQDAFKTKHKVLCCNVHTKDADFNKSDYRKKCSVFVGDMAEKTAGIIARELGLTIENSEVETA